MKMSRPKVILFYETHENALAVRRAIGDHEGLLQACDVATLKMLLRVHGSVDALVTEYGGDSAHPLIALAIAQRSGSVPRRILLTPRGATGGVHEAMHSGSATTVLFLPCPNAALRAALFAPIPGIWRPRAA